MDEKLKGCCCCKYYVGGAMYNRCDLTQSEYFHEIFNKQCEFLNSDGTPNTEVLEKYGL